MFEKEADYKLARKASKEQISKVIRAWSAREETLHDEGFQKGAEFGYNKAKEEWKKHFMQCSSPFCLDIFSSVKCYGELGNMAKKEGEEK